MTTAAEFESQRPRTKTKDLIHRIQVTLEDLYKGKTTRIALTRNVICFKCKGRCEENETLCKSCSGHGVKVTFRPIGPMIEKIRLPCQDCHGKGRLTNIACTICQGRKVLLERKFLDIHIDKGMKDGQAILFQGESDQSLDCEAGDVVIVIEEKPHDRLRRQENDLMMEVEVDNIIPLLAVLPEGMTIKHLDNRALIAKLKHGEVIWDGTFYLRLQYFFFLLYISRT